MENKEIVNFSKFFESKKNSNLSEFKKENFQDLFLSEEIEPLDEKETKEKTEPQVDIEEFVIDTETPEEIEIEDSLGSYNNKNNFTKIDKNEKHFFQVYKDKSENFSCDVLVEGAKISETQARLILESDDWTIMFNGEIDNHGKCTIPIKKLNIFEEGTMGKIRLEVIAENTVFIPWEDEFKVKMSKKVMVELHRNNSDRKVENFIKESNVKVKLR